MNLDKWMLVVVLVAVGSVCADKPFKSDRKACGKGFKLEKGKCVRKVKKCQEGYEKLSAVSETCVPSCKNCDHGRCIAPGSCKCYNGYAMNATNHCAPSCTTDCVNGDCVDVNVCQCKPGYRKSSDDAMAPCVPICDPPCENGDCVRPNECDCYPSYQLKEGSTHKCLTVCSFCEDNDCQMESDPCTCWESYEEQDISYGNKTVRVCRPKCEPDCVNGYCIEAKYCSCMDGYKFRPGSEHVCDPVCSSGCPNGQCIGPEMCACESGYVNGPTNATCEPFCASGCPNGSCSTPGKCSCDDGFATSTDESTCNPHCANGCTGGICVRPNECQCPVGFEFTTNRCEPICNSKCPNGRCTAPDLCECDEGYVPGPLNKTCAPHCASGCPNGWCSAPNECSCMDGYALTADGTACVPICEKDCTNGKCVRPNECQCNEGYAFNSAELCEPICAQECNNGQCIAPNQCACNEGYFKDLEMCVPFCKSGCPNGICSSPNQCSCSTGYELSSEGSCQPSCGDGCDRGICVSPNECQCEEGFVFSVAEQCHPGCSEGCQGGNCSAPNQCDCAAGYEYKDGRCLFVCLNGTPNPDSTAHCTCWPGFTLKAGNPHECEPLCANPTCVNADCVAHNQCTCWTGFQATLVAGVCAIPVPDCKDNSIFVDGQCVCSEGYTRTGDRCAPVCSNSCVGGECVRPNTCECPSDTVLTQLNERDVCTAIESITVPDPPIEVEPTKTTAKDETLRISRTSILGSMADTIDSPDADHERPVEEHQRIDTNDTHEFKMSLSSASYQHMYLIYIMAAVLAVAVVGGILNVLGNRKIDYSVIKTESQLGVEYHARGSVMGIV